MGFFLHLRSVSGPWRGRTTKKARLTEEQITGILQEHEACAQCADPCRRPGISRGAFHASKAKHSGMTVSETRRLKVLEDGNAKLKRLLAEQMPDMAATREPLRKNGDTRSEARGCRASEGPSWAARTAGVPEVVSRSWWKFDGGVVSG
ncbi:MAG: transposase [Rhodobacter sp.]|nr:transposase [Rhodobacter sp.]MCA3520010.1 transposase [Rhodobacter sp.]MCA3522274.1 transposase [Rhodobacter sp.]MCA3525260.1 transposase [Rhodobacter sp.]MCA3529345.1 transposase [Rhodobacter sp.]